MSSSTPTTTVFYFYMKQCPYCVQFTPSWNEVSDLFTRKHAGVGFVAVDNGRVRSPDFRAKFLEHTGMDLDALPRISFPMVIGSKHGHAPAVLPSTTEARTPQSFAAFVRKVMNQ